VGEFLSVEQCDAMRGKLSRTEFADRYELARALETIAALRAELALQRRKVEAVEQMPEYSALHHLQDGRWLYYHNEVYRALATPWEALEVKEATE
jgi:hypothetical protein